MKNLNVGISDYDRVRVGYRPPKTFGTRADRWLLDPSFLDSDEMVMDRDRARRRVPISQAATKDMAFDVIIYYIRTGDIPRELEWRNCLLCVTSFANEVRYLFARRDFNQFLYNA